MEYFHRPGPQISLQQRRSIEDEFQQARELVDYVNVPPIILCIRTNGILALAAS